VIAPGDPARGLQLIDVRDLLRGTAPVSPAMTWPGR
jgi:hypothetical protein